MQRVSKQRAEKLSGFRLDGRKPYAITDDGEPDKTTGILVFELIRWTDRCSGCTEFGDYGAEYGLSGCQECGYTGNRRRVEWVPVTESNLKSRAKGH